MASQTILLSTFIFPDNPINPSCTHLTIQCAIPGDTYKDVLSTSPAAESDFRVPSFPSSLISLQLDLFSLGYPAGFLCALARKLPISLSHLTLYSQIPSGLTPDSFADSLLFISHLAPNLHTLHFLDCMFPRGVPTAYANRLGEAGTTKLEELELSWLMRMEDDRFNDHLPSGEFGVLLLPSLRRVRLALRDRAQKPGLVPCFGGERVVEKLVEMSVAAGHTGLEELDMSVVVVTVDDVVDLMEVQKRKLRRLVVTVKTPEAGKGNKKRLLRSLVEDGGVELEELEVIWQPRMAFYDAVLENKEKAMSETLLSRQDINELTVAHPNLSIVKSSILRVASLGQANWVRQETSEGYSTWETRP